jgi:hypothetical protein
MGEVFLNLKTFGENIDDAAKFTKANNALMGKVGYVHLAKERQHMVLAQGKKFDIPLQHHSLGFAGEDRIFYHIRGGHALSRC